MCVSPSLYIFIIFCFCPLLGSQDYNSSDLMMWNRVTL